MQLVNNYTQKTDREISNYFQLFHYLSYLHMLISQLPSGCLATHLKDNTCITNSCQRQGDVTFCCGCTLIYKNLWMYAFSNLLVFCQTLLIYLSFIVSMATAINSEIHSKSQ